MKCLSGVFCVVVLMLSASIVVRGESNDKVLTGLFGAKFGKVMYSSDKCQTNNIGELVYEYHPDKEFRGYGLYLLFASPLSRKVTQIRAVIKVPYDEVDDEMRDTLKLLEMKFGKTAVNVDDDTRALFFANDDYISVTKDGRIITIDAVCDKLRKLNRQEILKADRVRFSSDIKALALLPVMEIGEDKLYRIDSVFGVRFGQLMPRTSDADHCKDGAWAQDITMHSRFLGCRNYYTFATEKTRKIFMVRSVYHGADWEECQEKVIRVLQLLTGRELEEDKDDKGVYTARFGDYLICLEKVDDVNKIMLSFVKISLYRQNEKEHEEVTRSAAMDDLNAL